MYIFRYIHVTHFFPMDKTGLSFIFVKNDIYQKKISLCYSISN